MFGRFESRHRKALIRLGYACNNKCLFCHSGHPSNNAAALSSEEGRRRIDEAARLGADMAVFSGGEPTIRRDIVDLCAYAAQRGLAAGIVTNGRVLCYEDFAEALVKAGLAYALVSIHGSDEETHNDLAGVASFGQAVAGLKNLSGRSVQIVVNAVLTKRNAGELEKMIGLFSMIGPIHFKISLPEPKGRVIENFDLVLHPKEAARIAANIFDGTRKNLTNVSVGVDGLTPCLLSDYFHRNDDFFTQGFFLVGEPESKRFYPPDHGDRSYLDSCVGCSHYDLCPGLYKKYFDAFPHIALTPISEPVSNALRYERVGSEPIEPVEEALRRPCFSKPDPARWIAVSNQGNADLFRTDEASTVVEDLLRIKFKEGQVYFCEKEREGGVVFPDHLKKMELDERCVDCEAKALCPGLFARSGRLVYEEAFEELNRILSSIQGRVLEIGCGSGGIFDSLQRGIDDGAVAAYVGIDPCLEDAMPEGQTETFQLFSTRLEDFEWSGRPFDFVLALRSINHLKDFDACLDKMKRFLRPGGKAIIAEDAKYIGLHDNPAAVGQGAAGFSHFRNITIGGIMRALEKRGFVQEEVVEVEPSSAGVWILVAKLDGVD